jgi:hypothetical protein
LIPSAMAWSASTVTGLMSTCCHFIKPPSAVALAA